MNFKTLNIRPLPFEESSDKWINPDKLELHISSLEGYPLSGDQLLDVDQVLNIISNCVSLRFTSVLSQVVTYVRQTQDALLVETPGTQSSHYLLVSRLV